MDMWQRKLATHGGFLIEAVLESIPQALLQTCFIVATGQYTMLNVYSIAVSLINIASKSVLISYNLHR